MYVHIDCPRGHSNHSARIPASVVERGRPSSKSCKLAQAVRSVWEGSTPSLNLLKYSCFSGVFGPRFRIIWFYLKSIVMPDHKPKFLHSSGSTGRKLLRYRVAPWPENGRTHAYHGRAFGNGDIHIF